MHNADAPHGNDQIMYCRTGMVKIMYCRCVARDEVIVRSPQI